MQSLIEFTSLFSCRNDGNSEDYPVMAFLCECKPRPGALSLEKCLKFGVPKGPLLGKLKNGETLTLDNGQTVRPEDVKEPDDPGPIFLGNFASDHLLLQSKFSFINFFIAKLNFIQSSIYRQLDF